MEEIALLRRRFDAYTQSNRIFEKAYWVSGLWGDYLEFGTFRGDSFVSAYAAAHKVYAEMVSEKWDHAHGDVELARDHFHSAWSEIRFIGFDSFEGMPMPEQNDGEQENFNPGTYACSEEDFLRSIASEGVDLAKVRTVKGFFKETLIPQTAQELHLKRVAVVHIDSDLYESAKRALDFVTPFLIDGAIIVFDEWFQFLASPYRGERRAFGEWCSAHPEWLVSGFQKEGAFTNSFVLSKRSTEEIGEQPPALYA